MKQTLLLLLLIISPLTYSDDFKHKHEIEVVRVIDGDTVDVNISLGFGIWKKNERIRLEGLDTPEVRTRDDREKFFGVVAKNKLKELLDRDATLVLRSYDTGKFGRTLGDFLLPDGSTAVEYLIDNHYGVEYDSENREEQHLINQQILIEKGVVDIHALEGL
jgi:micrococcal nuclease